MIENKYLTLSKNVVMYTTTLNNNVLIKEKNVSAKY